jgi:antitoxin (DNA-binding transcriptional repressor) of toxin-antitoxin stability system
MEDVMERTIDVTAARRQFGTLLDEVFHKKDIITIQRKGKSLAKIIPLESENHKNNNFVAITPRQKSLLEEMTGLPVIQATSDPTNILRSIREEKRIKANVKYGE